MKIVNDLRHIFPRAVKIKLLLMFIGVIAGALIETMTLSIIQPLIMVLSDPSVIYTNDLLSTVYAFFNLNEVAHFLAIMAVVVAVVYAFRGLYVYFFTRIQNRFIAVHTVNLSNRLLAQSLRRSYLYHVNHNAVQLQHTVIRNSERLFGFISAVFSFLIDAFMALFILAFLMISSFPMTMIVLLLAAICVIVYFRIFRGRMQASGDDEIRGQIQVNKSLLQALYGIKEIKVSRSEHHFAKKFKSVSASTIKIKEVLQSLRQLPKLFMESLCFSGAFIALAIVMLIGVDLQELLPLLGLFLVAAFKLLPAISRLTNNVTQIIRHKRSVNQVYDGLFDVDSDHVDEAPTIQKASDGIVVSGLTFKYPNNRKPVLRNVSLTIPLNKSVAFVGPSGAGKTTLIDIILGILSPQAGYITFNGESIHHNFSNWAPKIGYIPQSIYLMDETLLENIAFGVDVKNINEDKVWTALEEAQLKEFVCSLPDGLKTQIGDRGIRLSGGQRQRIGIARALYGEPEILVLDEATSALDNDTEKAVMSAIQGFKGRKTLIVVAHRLSTIESCDIIYKVENRTVTRTTLLDISTKKADSSCERP